MTGGIDVTLPEGAAECRAAAASLRAVVATLGGTVDLLDGPAALTREQLDGSAGTAYREAAYGLRTDAALLRTDLRGLAAGLTAYADRLDAARDAITSAREEARAHGFPTWGSTVHRPRWALPHDDVALDRIRATVDAARAEVTAAREAWAAALARHTGVAPPPVGPGSTERPGRLGPADTGVGAGPRAPLPPDPAAPVARPATAAPAAQPGEVGEVGDGGGPAGAGPAPVTHPAATVHVLPAGDWWPAGTRRWPGDAGDGDDLPGVAVLE